MPAPSLPDDAAVIAAEAEASGGPILIFDGVCNICAFGVGLVLRADRAGVFRYAFAQGAVGGALKTRHGLAGDIESVTLVENGRVLAKSDAVLGVIRHLGWAWKPWLVLGLLPKSVRDRLYLFVARNRYRWFGKKTVCLMPPAGAMPRFLDRP